MPTQLPVDFRFKRGTKDGLNHLAIDNGSLNFTVDTKEFYVDIDDRRLAITSVEFYNTEAEIKALTNIGDKMYVALDTKRILAFDKDTSEWIYLNEFYTEMSEEDAKEGVSTEAQVISAKTLNAAIENKNWDGNKAEYDAIEVKDPSVNYFITNA